MRYAICGSKDGLYVEHDGQYNLFLFRFSACPETVNYSIHSRSHSISVQLTREDVAAMQALLDAKFEDYEGEAGE